MVGKKNNPPIHATFVMEQHIGHLSYYQNLRRYIDQQPQLLAKWVEITYEKTGFAGRLLGLLPHQLRGSISGTVQVFQGLNSHPYDVSVYNTQVPAALTFGWATRKPAVLCTDITPIQYDEMAEDYHHDPDQNLWIRRIKFQANRKLFHNAARLLPWSSWTKDSLVDDYGVDPTKIEILPPGVDTNLWKPEETRRGDRVRILFVGGDYYRKGGELLMDAFQSLPPDTAELVLVTRSEISPSPGVRIYNQIQPNSQELIELYQSCHIFVLPTKAEAFGIAAVEASAAGLPVVASRVGGLRDIVIDGETGYLIPAMDGQTLTGRLYDLINDSSKRKAFGRKSRQHAGAHFDAQKIAARMSEILMEILQHE